jgi:hypothetical protein
VAAPLVDLLEEVEVEKFRKLKPRVTIPIAHLVLPKISLRSLILLSSNPPK